ncbi:PIN domain protein [Lyngbya aestuarii BL J]|uniref:PIN domain protein n=1 Tax=Lyngbya aestuarii BL J TaxID=1348334 RepID=U7QAL2_9CYAN|nr:PIN domain protein [Lyngbya aestuarii BL J]
MQRANLVTTEEVLVEVLTFFSTYGYQMRQRIVKLVEGIIINPNVRVIQQTHESFMDGLNLYKNRPDKGYSLTDCISMQTMRQLDIIEVLTNDKHFTQEGFIILLQEE